MYSNEVLLRGNGHSGQMLRQRHGRRLMYRHPSALSLPKLQEFVEYFFTTKKDSNAIPVPIPSAKREQPRPRAPAVLTQRPTSAMGSIPSFKDRQQYQGSDIHPTYQTDAPSDSIKELFPSETKANMNEINNNIVAAGIIESTKHIHSFGAHENEDLLLSTEKESHTPVSGPNSALFFQGYSPETPYKQSSVPTPVASASESDFYDLEEVKNNMLQERDTPSSNYSPSISSSISKADEQSVSKVTDNDPPSNCILQEAAENDEDDGVVGEDDDALLQDTNAISREESSLNSKDPSITNPVTFDREIEEADIDIGAESENVSNSLTDQSIVSERVPPPHEMDECDMESQYKAAEMYGSTHTANDSISFYSCADDGAFVPELSTGAFAHDSSEDEKAELELSANDLNLSKLPENAQEIEWNHSKSDELIISPVKSAIGSILEASTPSSPEIGEIISSNLVNVTGDISHTDEISQRLFDESITDGNNFLLSDANDSAESPLTLSYSLQYEQNYGEPLVESKRRELNSVTNAPIIPSEKVPSPVTSQYNDSKDAGENYSSPPKRQLLHKKSQLHGQDDLSSKFRLQAAELEEVTRARAALEIRLHETRQILEVFAAGSNARANDGKTASEIGKEKVSVVKFQGDENQQKVAPPKVEDLCVEKKEVSTKDASPDDSVEIAEEEHNEESPKQLSDIHEGTKQAIEKKHHIDKKIKFRMALKKAMAKSVLQNNNTKSAAKSQSSGNPVHTIPAMEPIVENVTATATKGVEPITMPSSSTMTTVKRDDPSSAMKLLTTSSKFFSGESAPSDIFEKGHYDYISNNKESKRPPSLPMPTKGVDPRVVVLPPYNSNPVRDNIPVASSSSSLSSSAFSSVMPPPSVHRGENVGGTTNFSRNKQTDISIHSSPTQSEKVLSPDSGNKVYRGGHSRKLSHSAPRVVTLELPDFDDEGQIPDKSDAKQMPIVNAGSKQRASLGSIDTANERIHLPVPTSDDSRRNDSKETVPTIDKVPSHSRNRSDSHSSLLRKKSVSAIQVPSDVSHQYLSQLRYVLEEIDDVISSTPPVRADESFAMESALPIELDTVAAAAAAAAAAVSVANRKSLQNSNIFRRSVGESLQMTQTKEDRLRRKQFVFDGSNVGDREASFARETDEEASFPSINSKDKIVNLRKRPSHNPGLRMGNKRDDASSEMVSTDRPGSSMQRSFQPPNDYYCGGDNVSVTSGITMESSLPTTPSPMKGDISIPGISTSHLPVYSYIEQDFEYFFRAQQQHKLNDVRSSYDSDGVDNQRYPMPPSSVEDNHAAKSTVASTDKQTGNNQMNHAFSMSLSYSSSLQSRNEWGNQKLHNESIAAENESKSSSHEKLKQLPARAQNSSSSLSNQSSAEKNTSFKDSNLDSSGDESSVSAGSPTVGTASLLDSHMRVVHSYFGPFLVAMKVSESSVSSRVSLDTAWEPILWCIFQMYGIADSVVVKHIKTSQISRSLKDAGICSINSSQLDLMLVKVYTKLSAAKDDMGAPMISPASSNSSRRSNLYLQSMLSKSLTGKSIPIASASATSTTSISQSTATFEAFKELNNRIAEHLVTSKAHKKAGAGVTDGTLFAQLEVMHTKFKELILSRTYDVCEVHLLESKVSISGLLLDTLYQRSTSLPHSIRELSHKQRGKQYLQQLISKSVFLSYAPSDIAVVKTVWERNIEQSRQIFLCYATPCQPSHKQMLGFEECREIMADFHIVPQLLDSQCFARIFRTCKLFEWRLAAIDSSTVDLATSAGKPNPALQEDYFDFKSTMGNFSLTFYGFLELLTRIACNNNKLGPSPPQSLENLLHLMDISGGKSKLTSKSSRKSVSVKSFLYANKH